VADSITILADAVQRFTTHTVSLFVVLEDLAQRFRDDLEDERANR
jgi:hypothetical protein